MLEKKHQAIGRRKGGLTTKIHTHADARVIDPINAIRGHVVILSKRNRLQPRSFDKKLYKARYLIENLFAKINQYRPIATCYDKLARHFLSAVHLVDAVIWLN